MSAQEKNVIIRLWCGTGYHEVIEVSLTEKLEKELRRMGYEAYNEGKFSYAPLSQIGTSSKFEVKDPRESHIFVTHPCSSAYVYETTPLEREAKKDLENYARGKSPKVRWIVKAHIHRFQHIEVKPIHDVRIPCWQSLPPYDLALKRWEYWQSDFGAIFLLIGTNERTKVQEWLYPPFLLGTDGKIIELPYEKERYVELTEPKFDDYFLSYDKKILLIADLHTMSNFGLSPETMRLENGQSFVASEGQKRLLRYWTHLMQSAEKLNVDEIWIVGDVWAGLNPKEKGRYITGTMDDQFNASIILLGMMPKTKKI